MVRQAFEAIAIKEFQESDFYVYGLSNGVIL